MPFGKIKRCETSSSRHFRSLGGDRWVPTLESCSCSPAVIVDRKARESAGADTCHERFSQSSGSRGSLRVKQPAVVNGAPPPVS